MLLGVDIAPVDKISLLANEKLLDDANRPWDFKKLHQSVEAWDHHSCIHVILKDGCVQEECSRGDRVKGKGKTKKCGPKACKNCGERPWTDDDNWTPRCRCGWW